MQYAGTVFVWFCFLERGRANERRPRRKQYIDSLNGIKKEGRKERKHIKKFINDTTDTASKNIHVAITMQFQ